MAALFVIIITKRGNHTPTPTQIVKVLMREAPCARPKVEAEGPERRVFERTLEIWVFFLQSCQDPMAKIEQV